MRGNGHGFGSDEAVSPVVAVLLLLAITVILSGVVYLTVSNLMVKQEDVPVAFGVITVQTGLNWSVTIVSSPAGLNASFIFVIINSPNGTTLLPRTALADMPEFQDISRNGLVDIGDGLVLPVSEYHAGCQVLLMNERTVMYSGQLRS